MCNESLIASQVKADYMLLWYVATRTCFRPWQPILRAKVISDGHV